MSWEYATKIVGEPIIGKRRSAWLDMDAALNLAEDNGWELVSAAPARWSDSGDCTAYRLFFKRPAAGPLDPKLRAQRHTDGLA